MSNLRTLIAKPSQAEIRYPADVENLRKALQDMGLDAPDHLIQWAWNKHSSDWDAGWLGVTSVEEAKGEIHYLLEYLNPEDGEPV